MATATVVNNGRRDVPAMLLLPIAVDKATIDDTLIRDGFHPDARGGLPDRAAAVDHS